MFANCIEVWLSEHSAPKRTAVGPYEQRDAVPTVNGGQIIEFKLIHSAPGHIRGVNENKVIETLRAQPGISRPQIAKITRLSTVTIGHILDQLIKDDVVTVLPPLSKRGQPTSRYELKEV